MLQLTLQNCIPLTLLPRRSSGGDHTMMPQTLGTTIRMAPLTPDLAGKPTCGYRKLSEGLKLSDICLCISFKNNIIYNAVWGTLAILLQM